MPSTLRQYISLDTRNKTWKELPYADNVVVIRQSEEDCE